MPGLTPRQRAAAEAEAAATAAAAKREAAAAKRKALGPEGSAPEVPEHEPSDLSFVVPTHTSRSGFDNGFYESGWMYF